MRRPVAEQNAAFAPPATEQNAGSAAEQNAAAAGAAEQKDGRAAEQKALDSCCAPGPNSAA